MDKVAIITAVLSMIAGIGIFLVACSMMSSNLEAVSSNRLKALFAKASKSKMVGVGIGALSTAAIQSSGATTVMVIGFVNAGIMSLAQAATVIYGANIGTTITGQIVALGMAKGNAVSTTVIFSAFAGIGSFLSLFVKRDVWKKIGGILSGFGMLFVGLSMMSGAMEVFSTLDIVKHFLASLDHVVLLVLVGALLTAIIQSSSVMTSIAITMVVTGLISLNQGIYLTMGSNIGSCVVALLAGISSSKNAKRTALIHLCFNVSGVLVFLLFGCALELFSGSAVNYGVIFERLYPGASQTQLAMFHTIFNVLTVLFMLPFTNLLTQFVTKLIPEREAVQQNPALEERLYYVDVHMLKTPPIAVAQVKNEIINMADLAMTNFTHALQMICDLDFSAQKQFEENEKKLNYINRELFKFVVSLSKTVLNEKDYKYISTTFHTISDLERVGDYAENILEYAHVLAADNQHFSASAISEIQYMKEHIDKLFDCVIKAYLSKDVQALQEAYKVEDEVDRITDRMAQNHIIRIDSGICTAMAGSQYLSLSANAERVADHFMNVGNAIQDWA